MNQLPFRILGVETSFLSSEGTDQRKPNGFGEENGRAAPKTTGTALSGQASSERRMTVRLADILPILMDAAKSDRQWLQDFGSDEIQIPYDLYEVALAYRAMGRAA